MKCGRKEGLHVLAKLGPVTWGHGGKTQPGQVTNEELCFDLLVSSLLSFLRFSGMSSRSPSSAGSLFLLRFWAPAPARAL